MANVLRIFDVSNIIKRGYINKRAIINGGIVKTAKGYKSLFIPSGGISFLFRMIKQHNHDTLAFCCDRTPDFKRDIMSSYKSGGGNSFTEDVKQNIDIQLKVVEEILKDCSYPVYAEEHYEADDLIYSLVKRYHDDFDHIYIHTTDSDVQFLVDDKVSIGLVGNAGKEVTRENYEYTVISNKVVPYNTRLTEKMFHGGKDGIPALRKDLQVELQDYLYCNDFSKQNCGNKEFVLNIIKEFVPEAEQQALITFPLDAPINGDVHMRPQIDKVNTWGFLVGCRDYPPVQKISDDINALKKTFFDALA